MVALLLLLVFYGLIQVNTQNINWSMDTEDFTGLREVIGGYRLPPPLWTVMPLVTLVIAVVWSYLASMEFPVPQSRLSRWGLAAVLAVILVAVKHKISLGTEFLYRNYSDARESIETAQLMFVGAVLVSIPLGFVLQRSLQNMIGVPLVLGVLAVVLIHLQTVTDPILFLLMQLGLLLYTLLLTNTPSPLLLVAGFGAIMLNASTF
jgi:hypothetical protein